MSPPELRRLAKKFDDAGDRERAAACRNRAATRELGVSNLTDRADSSNRIPLMPMGGPRKKGTRSVL